jgi:hypothetical protein
MLGGDLNRHDSFKYILSIGYEFETHDLAKLSLSDDVLINSSNTARDMSKKLLQEVASKTDDNNYEIIDEIDEDNALYYTEYFDEYDGQANDNLVMNITNDIGSSSYDKMLQRKCKNLEGVNKNDLYVFQSTNGERYDINFDSLLLNRQCSIFSGLEFVMTFFKIQKSPNIILETFLNTCYRIFSHFNKLEKIPGDLLLKDEENGEEIKIGDLDERILFHKPNTNLYYMQTHDNDYFSKPYTLGMITFLPQMTFRANIKHVISIIKDILNNTDLTRIKRTKQLLISEYNAVCNIEKCANELIDVYNTTSKSGRKITKSMRPEVVGYLFMIFYKIYMFVEYYNLSDMTDEENYFKNCLSFSARHSNLVFYDKFKSVMSPQFGEDTVSTIITLLDQPDIVSKYMYLGRKKKALKTKLKYNDEHYGNPAYSFISYFEHFETPLFDAEGKPEKEWFIYRDVDVFSTHFELPKDGSIIIENRLFFSELVAFANDNVNLYAPNSFTLNNLKNIYTKLIKSNLVTDLSQKELNPNTLRFVKKCKSDQVRNEDFVCKPKKTKKVAKKPAKKQSKKKLPKTESRKKSPKTRKAQKMSSK